MVQGDFSCVLLDQDRLNYKYNMKDTENYRQLIFTYSLCDVPITNYDFTWFGSKDKCSRIHREGF